MDKVFTAVKRVRLFYYPQVHLEIVLSVDKLGITYFTRVNLTLSKWRVKLNLLK